MKKKFCKFISLFILAAMVFSFCGCGENALPRAIKSNNPERILKAMSLEDKLAQMLMPRFRYTTDEAGEKQPILEMNELVASALEQYNFGGMILFGQNYETTQQVVQLISDIRAKSQTPLLMAVDQEGGSVTRIQSGCIFGGNMSLAAANDTELTQRVAATIGEEIKAVGFDIDFAPVLDVNTNPSNPVIGTRSFSDDAEVVAEQGIAYLQGLNNVGIVGAVKHFPGHGNTATDSHTGLPLVDKSREELEQTELVPFKAAIEQGVQIIMTAHIQYPQITTEKYISKLDGQEITLPATLSKEILTDLLRDELGYDGIIVTDSLLMDAISQHFDLVDVAKLAINAGADILLIPMEIECAEDLETFGTWFDAVLDLVKSGEISEDTIDQAVLRILKLKSQLGLFTEEQQTAEEITTAAESLFNAENHRQIEWEAAESAVTLVKDDDVLSSLNLEDAALFLPYSGEEAMVQPAFDSLGYTPETVIYKDKTIEDFEEILASHENLVVVSEMGSPAYLDPSNEKGWQAEFIDSLLEKAHALDKNVILISGGLPYDAGRFSTADAILCVYNASSKGYTVAAALKLLGEKAEITGQLPVNIYAYDDEYQPTDELLFARTAG